MSLWRPHLRGFTRAVPAAAPAQPDQWRLIVNGYTQDGTWIAPVDFWGLTGDYRRAKVELIGSTSDGVTSYAPGGGAYSRGDNVALPEPSYPIAGIGRPLGGTAEDATFGEPPLVKASSGKPPGGGIGGLGGQAADCIGDVAFDGANAASSQGGAGAGAAEAAFANTRGGFYDGGHSGQNNRFGCCPGGAPGGSRPGTRGFARISYREAAAPGYARLIGHTVTRYQASTTITVAPPPTAQAGDLALVIAGVDGNFPIVHDDIWATLDAITTDSVGTTSGTTAIRMQVFWRRLDGTAADTLIVTGGTTWTAQMLVYRGAGDPTAASARGATANAPLAPHSVPAGGSLVWVTALAQDGLAGSSGVDYLFRQPAEYEDFFVLQGALSTSGVALGVAARQSHDQSAALSGNWSNGALAWCATTIAIPAAA